MTIQTNNIKNGVTYFIGAGASFDALPIVSKMSDAILEIKNHVDNEDKRYDRDIIANAKEYLDFLHDACTNHLSIDTYAKMLFLTGDDANYLKTKNLMILFFELYFYYKKKIDKRYDAFLASIISKNGPRFPEHINVISWNYDYEFEKAFSKYLKLKIELEEVYSQLNVFHKNCIKPYLNSDNFKLVKINGTMGYWKNDGHIKLGLSNYFLTEQEKKLNFTGISRIMNKYNDFSKSIEHKPAISFAWENDIADNTAIQEAKKIMMKTEILIVIGYSFPYFNREVDRLLLSKECAPNLRKVYVQDLEPDNIIETMKGFRENDWTVYEGGGMKDKVVRFVERKFTFVPIRNLEQFHMPHEL